jgi:hypothetical protein
MSFVAIITGIAGEDRFLSPTVETAEARRAKRFRSEGAAEAAAQAHVRLHPAVIQRHLTYRVEAVA